jgi:hypothetical protein
MSALPPKADMLGVETDVSKCQKRTSESDHQMQQSAVNRVSGQRYSISGDTQNLIANPFLLKVAVWKSLA